MKTAIYIDEGRMQLVLTPESDFENQVIAGIQDKEKTVNIHNGQFYACAGGWNRHTDSSSSSRSLIIVCDKVAA